MKLHTLLGYAVFYAVWLILLPVYIALALLTQLCRLFSALGEQLEDWSIALRRFNRHVAPFPLIAEYQKAWDEADHERRERIIRSLREDIG